MFNKTNIDSGKKHALIVYIVLTVVTLAVYWQLHNYGFIIFDDHLYIEDNPRIQSGITTDGIRWAFTTRYLDLWHPLVWISFMFDYQLHGLNAGGYHVTNFILHILSTLLLFRLFHRMTKAIWASAFVAALFALHPLHVESVAWVAERKDVLSAFFWMLTLYFYVYYTEKPVIGRYLLAFFTFILALMSKPMVVTLPVVMILLDYWPLDRLRSRKITEALSDVETVAGLMKKGKKKNKLKKDTLRENISRPAVTQATEPKIAGIIPLWQLKEKIPFFILSAVIAVTTVYSPVKYDALNPPDLIPVSFISRLANAPVVFVGYLGKTLCPYDMAVFYPFPDHIPVWQFMGATLLIILITAVVIIRAKRMPYLITGWLWFALTIAPVIGIIQISKSAPYAMADRYHYLPSIGLAVMIAWGIPPLIKSEEIRKKILFPAGIIFFAILSILSWKQCGYWKNHIVLFKHTLKVTENNALAHNSIGLAFYRKGKIADAFYHHNEAIRIVPTYAEAYINRGNCYDETGQYHKAIEDFNEAIHLKPHFAMPYYNRGNACRKLGQYQQAIGDYTEAIMLNPDYTEAYRNRAGINLEHGNERLGCLDAQKACELGLCDALSWAKNRGMCR